jgi:hypothetical protein
MYTKCENANIAGCRAGSGPMRPWQRPWATAWEGPVSASLLCTFPLEKEFGKGPKAQRDVFMERNEAMERNKHS